MSVWPLQPASNWYTSTKPYIHLSHSNLHRHHALIKPSVYMYSHSQTHHIFPSALECCVTQERRLHSTWGLNKTKQSKAKQSNLLIINSPWLQTSHGCDIIYCCSIARISHVACIWLVFVGYDHKCHHFHNEYQYIDQLNNGLYQYYTKEACLLFLLRCEWPLMVFNTVAKLGQLMHVLISKPYMVAVSQSKGCRNHQSVNDQCNQTGSLHAYMY